MKDALNAKEVGTFKVLLDAHTTAFASGKGKEGEREFSRMEGKVSEKKMQENKKPGKTWQVSFPQCSVPPYTRKRG